MPETKALQASAPWVELWSTPEDVDRLDATLLGTMLTQLVVIRAFEEEVLDLAGQRLINGPAHSSIGQEGGAVGSALLLTPADQINGSHRGHHQFLAKALNFVAPDGLSPTAPLPDEAVEVLRRTLAEIAGLADGYCRGRGGSMHLQWKDAGAMGTNAIVGGAVPFSTGFAWSHLAAGTDAVAVTYFGDGAANIGSALESFNLAAAWKLPVCFFIENNQYAVSTSVEEATGEPRLSGRGPGMGIPSWRVDGQDTIAVYLAMREAVAHMRAGGGPTLIEADTYRFFHQNGPFPGSAFGYRTKEEEQGWQARDPLPMLARALVERDLLTDDDVDALVRRSKEHMRELSSGLLETDPDGRPGQQRIRPGLWPDPAFVDVGILGETDVLGQMPLLDDVRATAATTDMKYVDAIAAVVARRMEQDERVIVLGEDVHRLKGGSRGATKGLVERFPDRVLGTPISEAAFTGLGGGIALDGRFYPIVELMYADFIWVSADQLFNQIGKARHMFGGGHAMPLLLRVKVGINTGYGSQHSMDPAGILATAVGWRVIAPSTAEDYIALVNTALRLGDPVAVLEHDADLYQRTFEVPDVAPDYGLPVGQAARRRAGEEVTVLTYMSMVDRCVEAAARSGIDADVIDLRWLDRASLDWDMISESVQRTNRVLIVEQGPLGTSYGGWLGDEIARRLFDWLDAPVGRVHGSVSSPSISKALEQAALADTDAVIDGLRALL